MFLVGFFLSVGWLACLIVWLVGSVLACVLGSVCLVDW